MSFLDVVDIEICWRRRIWSERLESGPVVTERQLGLGRRLLLPAAGLRQSALYKRKVVQVPGYDGLRMRRRKTSRNKADQRSPKSYYWKRPLHEVKPPLLETPASSPECRRGPCRCLTVLSLAWWPRT